MSPIITRALHRHAWLVVIFFGFLCLYSSVQNIGYFDASDAWHRFRMMQALVTTGNPYWTEPGQTEPQTCLQTIGPAIIALPLQAVAFAAKKLGLINIPLEQALIRATLLTTVLVTSLWMCIIAVLCRRLGASRRRAFAVVIIAGLATMIFPYSKSAQGENLVGLCITLITLLILRLEGHNIKTSVAIGLIYGFLLSCKPELALVFPLLLIAVQFAGRPWKPLQFWSQWRRALAFGIGIIPGVSLILWYNYIRFGSITNSGTLGEVGAGTAVDYFSHPFFEGLHIQLTSPGKGILWYSPVLLATLPFIPKVIQRGGRLMLLPYVWWLVMTCLYAKFFTPTGDAALGSRFQVSYLAFGVLPLAVLPSWKQWQPATVKLWLILCTTISVALQTLFCLVSFNIDYHRRLYSVDTLQEQVALARRAYFSIDESLLRGFFSTAREGLLDLYFIRLRPLEAALTIYPGIWWLLAATACAFGTAFHLTMKSHPGRHPRRQLIKYQVPAIILATFGVIQVGHPGRSGLKLTMESPGRALHQTIVQDIAIANFNDGREVYKVHQPFVSTWKGEMYCPEPGLYEFQIDSSQSTHWVMASQQNHPEPGNRRVEFMILDAGWQPLQIIMPSGTMTDHIIVRTRAPGESDFKSLSTRRLRN